MEQLDRASLSRRTSGSGFEARVFTRGLTYLFALTVTLISAGCLMGGSGGSAEAAPSASDGTASTAQSGTTSANAAGTTTGGAAGSGATPGSSGSGLPATASAPLPLGCASEGGLAGRTDVVHCEPFEDPAWWSKGYVNPASHTKPAAVTADQMTNTSIVSTGCLAGHCLKSTLQQYKSGSLAVHWPFKNNGLAPENMYLRYYMKLSSTFQPDTCRADGTNVGTGGKFPGLADIRTWPEEQCGNGGAWSDGINCWSMRTHFRNCTKTGGTQVCTNPSAHTRIGSYLYYPNQDGFDNAGLWDAEKWGQGLYNEPFGSCATARDVGGCGIGIGGQLENEKWYRVEMQVKMNTPGQSNGEIRGWVDGVLSYQKTNMIFRLPGHDNLHVRTIWLNIYAGGVDGLCQAAEVHIDQLVAATGSPPGAWRMPTK